MKKLWNWFKGLFKDFNPKEPEPMPPVYYESVRHQAQQMESLRARAQEHLDNEEKRQAEVRHRRRRLDEEDDALLASSVTAILADAPPVFTGFEPPATPGFSSFEGFEGGQSGGAGVSGSFDAPAPDPTPDTSSTDTSCDTSCCDSPSGDGG